MASERSREAYSHGMALFQSLDGLLEGFAFFISQDYQDYLVVWHRLIAEVVSQGPLRAYGQTGVQTTSFWKVATNLVGYFDPARGGDILVPAVGPCLIEFCQHLLVLSSKTLDWVLPA